MPMKTYAKNMIKSCLVALASCTTSCILFATDFSSADDLYTHLCIRKNWRDDIAILQHPLAKELTTAQIAKRVDAELDAQHYDVITQLIHLPNAEQFDEEHLHTFLKKGIQLKQSRFLFTFLDFPNLKKMNPTRKFSIARQAGQNNLLKFLKAFQTASELNLNEGETHTLFDDAITTRNFGLANIAASQAGAQAMGKEALLDLLTSMTNQTGEQATKEAMCAIRSQLTDIRQYRLNPSQTEFMNYILNNSATKALLNQVYFYNEAGVVLGDPVETYARILSIYSVFTTHLSRDITLQAFENLCIKDTIRGIEIGINAEQLSLFSAEDMHELEGIQAVAYAEFCMNHLKTPYIFAPTQMENDIYQITLHTPKSAMNYFSYFYAMHYAGIDTTPFSPDKVYYDLSETHISLASSILSKPVSQCIERLATKYAIPHDLFIFHWIKETAASIKKHLPIIIQMCDHTAHAIHVSLNDALISKKNLKDFYVYKSFDDIANLLLKLPASKELTIDEVHTLYEDAATAETSYLANVFMADLSTRCM